MRGIGGKMMEQLPGFEGRGGNTDYESEVRTGSGGPRGDHAVPGEEKVRFVLDVG